MRQNHSLAKRRFSPLWLISASCVAVVTALSGSTNLFAYKAYADKEGKPCAYCHVNPNGGGKRNYRGRYYKMNGLTFAKFDDAAEAKKAGEEIGPVPEPKPKSWTAPDAAGANPTAPATAPTMEKPKTVADAQARVAAAEKVYAAALADLGHLTMLDESQPPAKRYPDALRILRKAAAVDPTNKDAQEDIKMIEDVYKKMGRPIPK